MKRSALTICAALLCACGGGNVASELAQPPDFNPDDQTKCKVKKSQSKPLIVEWPSADRGELESKVGGRQIVVVRYDGCEMRLLSHCKAPGRYVYKAVTPKEDTVTIENEDQLYANIPVYAAKFEGKLATSGQLNVAMTMVGRYEADRIDVSMDDLDGRCDGATHIIAGLTAGAFEFFAGADAEVGGGIGVMDAGAGAKSAAKRETLTRDGDKAACTAAAEGDGPPSGCGALLRVEVLPLAAAAAQPAQPAATTEPPATTSGAQPAKPTEEERLAQEEARRQQEEAARKRQAEAEAAAKQAKPGKGDIPADPNLPSQPSRQDVRNAINQMTPRIQKCRAMVKSQVKVQVVLTVAPSGRVTHATMSGGPSEVAGCVGRAARGVRFPAFSGPTFKTKIPIVLTP